jgi:hypothetical protein
MGFVRSPRGFYPTVVECRLEKIAVEAAGDPRPKMLLVRNCDTIRVPASDVGLP